jgi:PadR family transcriptional regulator PadR
MPTYLGEFEQLVLLAVVRLGDHATGAAIRAIVQEGSQRVVWIGAVHTTLERLDAKGLVRSRMSEPKRPGDRARKTYALLPAGRTALSHAYGTWVRMTRGLKPTLESF